MTVTINSPRLSPKPFLLDQFTGAEAAYSLRRLTKEYTGSAIRVQRTLDDTELDIGFDVNGNLDIPALLTFIPTGDALVTTWYDQSGNNNDATETLNLRMARIVANGILIKNNGLVAMEFDGTDDRLENATVALSTLPLTLFSWQKLTASPGSPLFVLELGDVSGDDDSIVISSSNTVTELGVKKPTNSPVSIAAPLTGADAVYYSKFTSVNQEGRVGATLGTNTDLTSSFTVDNVRIGHTNNAGTREGFWEGFIQEIVIYRNDKSGQSVAIQENIKDYWTGLLLDLFPGATAAYSLRKIKSDYTGPAIQALARFPFELQDIGFTPGGDLDKTALMTFLGDRTGEVNIWYDQSGNGNDFVEADDFLRPQIAKDGLCFLNPAGLPAINFEGTSEAMVMNGLATPITGTSTAAFVVCDNIISMVDWQGILTGTNIALNVDSTNEEAFIYLLRTSSSLNVESFSNNEELSRVTGGIDDGLYHQFSSLLSNNIGRLFMDGTEGTLLGTRTGQLDIDRLVIPGRNITPTPNNTLGIAQTSRMQFSEIVVYPSDQADNREGIEISQNDYWKPSVPNPLLLDLFPGSSSAFSLRKLRNAYAGSAIRVRRDNDNAEADIGFDSKGNLDLAALATHVGANSGFVTTWYDQSGNGINAVQATSSFQPRIVNSGTTDVNNALPAILFDGADDRIIANVSSLANPAVPTSVFTFTNFAGFIAGLAPRLVDLSDSVGTQLSIPIINAGNTAMGVRFPTPAQLITFVGNQLNRPRTLYYGLRTASSQEARYADLIGTNNNTITTPPTNVQRVRIGFTEAGGSPDGFWNGSVQELIVYPVDRFADNANIRDESETYWAGLPLDAWPTATAAYSLRKLRKAYTGSAIRVKRDVDNVETDLGFDDDGNFDRDAMAQFIGGTNSLLIVIRIYDQSGNGIDLNERDPDVHALVERDGRVITIFNRPGLASVFSGGFTADVSISTLPLTIFSYQLTQTADANTRRSLFLGDDLAATNEVFIGSSITQSVFGYRLPENQPIFNNSDLSNPLITYYSRISTLLQEASVDTETPITNLNITTTFTADKLRLGYEREGSENSDWSGKLQEFFIYNTDRSADRVDFIKHLKKYWRLQ